MKLIRILVASATLLAAQAGPPAESPRPPDFKMSIACFSDTVATKPEWIFVIGGTAFRSLEALKDGITHFPKGSTLTWAPGCCRIGGEPLSQEADLKALEAHCAAHGIRFIVVPSG